MKPLLLFLAIATWLAAQTPPLNFLAGSCNFPVGVYSILWTGATSYPLCAVIGPTLKLSTVNGRAQLDAVIPPPPVVTTSGGASMATQLGDFAVTRISATQLLLGSGCSAATPCNVRYGEAVAQFTSRGLITISAGDGMARACIDGSVSPPIIRVVTGGTVTVTCTGISCVVGTGNAFPADSIPLASWPATAGTWDVQGGIDYRAVFSSLRFVAGPGISIVNLNGTVTITADPASIAPQP
jgi:hypothetical protein